MGSDWDCDESGEVELQPMTGVHVVPVMEIAVAARIQYLFRQDGRETAATIQLVMTPSNALDLAADLKKAAKRVLAATAPRQTN